MTQAINLPLRSGPVRIGTRSEPVVLRSQRSLPAVLEEFLEASSRADSVSELVEVYRRALAQLGFEFFAWTQVSDGAAASAMANRTSPILAFNGPAGWLERYAAEGYFSTDPMIRHARASATPFEWGNVPVRDTDERRVLHEAGEAGIRAGLCIPIHEPQGRLFLVSAATAQRDFDAERARPLVHMFTAHIHARFREVHESATEPCAQLTARERECLLWCARGKSSWDISRLLSISEHTVNFHVKNAMNKLGTSTRVSAVLKGVSLGLIAP